jgi:hypothetical protein
VKTNSFHIENVSAARAVQAEILDRFPREDHKDAEFPRDMVMFCFPKGLGIQEDTGEDYLLHSFALTEEDGARVYGSALIFFEPVEAPMGANSFINAEPEQMDEEAVSPSHKAVVKYVMPKALCLTSHWPFYENLQRFLAALFDARKEKVVKIPIERMIANLIHETPLPPRGRMRVHMICYKADITFERPAPNELPLFNLPFNRLFQHLSVDNILLIFGCMLVERRIMFISERINKLTECIETLSFFLFPFYWRHIFIPILPKKLIDFVCAPMPFVVGIHKSYMPDELMLGGVVVVDVDSNTVLCDSENPITPLPEKSGSRLSKHLRKIMSVDTSAKLSMNAELDKRAVCDAFCSFFVSIMKNYKDYMEAPSEFVVDKFNKDKWLETHPEKGPFFEQFLDTQMFQCFVDDRYEASPANLDILIFDELIDRENGKAAAFLTDTSNAHKETHEVMNPIPEKFDFPGSISYNGKFPVALKKEYFGESREAPKLFDSSNDSEVQRVGMSSVALKFFTDKNMYSRHFHSLRSRSSKQDQTFKDIVSMVRLHQGYIDIANKEFNRICQRVLGKELVETGTSIDNAWVGMLTHLEERRSFENHLRPNLREKFTVALYKKANEVEHELAVLFDEAQKLDLNASRGKSDVDNARNRHQKMKAKLKHTMASVKGPETFSNQNEISKRISAESDCDSALLLKAQAEISFRGIVAMYERRMPQIVEDVRRLNGERISLLKTCLEEYLRHYKKYLSEMTKSVGVFEQKVQEIDVEKDVKTFSEGKLEWGKIVEGKNKSSTGDTAGSPGSVNETIDENSTTPDASSKSMALSPGDKLGQTYFFIHFLVTDINLAWL